MRNAPRILSQTTRFGCVFRTRFALCATSIRLQKQFVNIRFAIAKDNNLSLLRLSGNLARLRVALQPPLTFLFAKGQLLVRTVGAENNRVVR
jgi:hypothetical protein